jgi:hypothetical protein
VIDFSKMSKSCTDMPQPAKMSYFPEELSVIVNKFSK